MSALSIDAQAKAEAPPVPPETCPMVDSLSTLMDAIAGDIATFREGMSYGSRKTIAKDEVMEILLQTEQGIASARLKFEDLRNANEQLRTSGRFWRIRFRALAKQREAAA